MKKLGITIIREINDPIINREDILHRLLRFFLRIYINLPFNILFPKEIFKILLVNNPILYKLIKINIFYKEYITYLEKGNLEKILTTKTKWANYVIQNKNTYDVRTYDLALNYRYLIDKYLNNNFSKLNSFDSFDQKQINFYIYGPNSENYPSKLYKNNILVLTKFPNFSIDEFRETILFLNNHTINTKSDKELKEKCRNFKKIYIPHGTPRLLNNMINMPKLPQGVGLGGPMGFARILFCLKDKVKKPIIKIEGFDLGISKKAYSGKIESLYNVVYKKKNFESHYRLSLLDHDLIYNFLVVKDLLEDFIIFNSTEFTKIVNKDLESFFKEIYTIREFKKLRYKID